jgi:putative membrane protein
MSKPFIAATALALCACSAHAQTGRADSPAKMVPSAAPAYLARAGAGDLYEIQSSQLAQQKATAANIRDFAQMMIEHHTGTTRKLMSAARAAGIAPSPPALEPPQRAMIEELRSLSGNAFDAAYLRQQRAAHDQALALHSSYAENGDRPALRVTARSAVPIIRTHIDRLDAITPR